MPVRDVRRRYLYVEVSSGEEFNESHFRSALDEKIHFLYGVTGAVSLNHRLIEWDEVKQSAIVRCNHNVLNEMRATIAHIGEINGATVRLDVKRVSGTIKTIKSKL